jgi:hypothetical protein
MAGGVGSHREHRGFGDLAEFGRCATHRVVLVDRVGCDEEIAAQVARKAETSASPALPSSNMS